MAYEEKKVIGAYLPVTQVDWVKNRAETKKLTVSKYLNNLIEKDKKNVEKRK